MISRSFQPSQLDKTRTYLGTVLCLYHCEYVMLCLYMICSTLDGGLKAHTCTSEVTSVPQEKCERDVFSLNKIKFGESILFSNLLNRIADQQIDII